MTSAGKLVALLFAAVATDSAAPAALPQVRFVPNRGARYCDLFINGTFSSVTVQPVFQRPRRPGQDALTELPDQFDDSTQAIALAAAGGAYRRINVPPGFDVALRVTALAGGNVQAMALFSEDV